MTALLLDTHVWAWSFNETGNLSPTAAKALVTADAVYVSPISFFEIAQKTRLGKWPEMDGFANRLVAVLEDQSGLQAPISAEVYERAGWLDWNHRDPFDRLIAATALHLNIPLVTKDAAFASLDGLAVVW